MAAVRDGWCLCAGDSICAPRTGPVQKLQKLNFFEKFNFSLTEQEQQEVTYRMQRAAAAARARCR